MHVCAYTSDMASLQLCCYSTGKQQYSMQQAQEEGLLLFFPLLLVSGNHIGTANTDRIATVSAARVHDDHGGRRHAVSESSVGGVLPFSWGERRSTPGLYKSTGCFSSLLLAFVTKYSVTTIYSTPKCTH